MEKGWIRKERCDDSGKERAEGESRKCNSRLIKHWEYWQKI